MTATAADSTARRLLPAPPLLAAVALWALLAAALPWADSSGWLLLWLALGTLILLAAVFDLWQLRQPSPIRAERLLPSALSLQRPHTVRVRLQGLKPGQQLLLADQHPADDLHTGLPRRIRGQAQSAISEFHYRYTPQRRGPVQFADIELWLNSPLQLWQYRQCHPATCTVPVYPDFSRLRHNELSVNQGQLLSGNRRRPRRGEGMEFHQLRDYHPGDSLRQIDWKATARRRSLISREYQDEQNQQVLVMLDGGRRLGMPVGKVTGLDHALNATLLLAWSALKQKDKAGAMLFSGDQNRWIPPVHGQQGLNQLLNGFYDLYPSRHASDFSQAARQLLQRWRRRSLVVLITRLHHEDEQELLRAVALLRKHHLVLIADMLLPEQQALAQQPASDFDGALQLCAHHNEARQREALHTRLRHAGALVTASEPDTLPAQLNQLYLALKRSGTL